MISIISLESLVEFSSVKVNEMTFKVVSETASGFGINLARYLNYLDIKNRVFTFLGGFNGYKIRELCRKENIRLKYVPSNIENGEFIKFFDSDSNFKIVHEDYSKKALNAFDYLVLREKKEFAYCVLDVNENNGCQVFRYLNFIKGLSKKFNKTKLIINIAYDQLDFLLELDDLSAIFLALVYDKNKTENACVQSKMTALKNKNCQHITLTNDKKNLQFFDHETEFFLEKPTGFSKEVFLAGFLFGQKQQKDFLSSSKLGLLLHQPVASKTKVSKKALLNFAQNDDLPK